MAESRGAKYGRNLALWVRHTIDTVPEDERDSYRSRLIEELRRYSFQTRKKGQPLNKGCVYELAGMDDIDVEDPCDLGKLIKEGVHLMYQKSTAAKVLDSLIDNLG